MFAKGLIYGIVVGGLNLLVLYLTLRHIVIKSRKFAAFSFFVLYGARYVILGALVYVFLRAGWGSPLGLLAGLSIGLVVSVIWRIRYHDGTAGSC